MTEQRHDETARLPQVRLHLTGPESSPDNALLVDFTSALRAINITLQATERCVRGDAPTIEYEIADLVHSSASAVVVPSPGKSDVSLASIVIDKHREAIRALESGRELDPIFDEAAILSFQSLGWPIRPKGPRLTVGDVSITPAFKANVAKLLEPPLTSFGSVSGRLEAVSLHGDPAFVLYPPGSRQAVSCRFKEEDVPRVFEACKRKAYVTVYGELAFKQRKPFPVSANVTDIDYHPDAETLSDLLDAVGVATDVEGDPVDLVRRRRNEWRRD